MARKFGTTPWQLMREGPRAFDFNRAVLIAGEPKLLEIFKSSASIKTDLDLVAAILWEVG